MRSSLVVLVLCLSLPATADARSWCASPIHVHEWGVQVFSATGAPQNPVPLPGYFHRAASGPGAASPVRHLPPDSGIRTLPVLQFYASPAGRASIPIGIEVGFAHGDAAIWYPQVDALRPSALANSPQARQARAELLAARQALTVFGGPRPELASDPTRQLVWQHLELSPSPRHARRSSAVDWVGALRGVDALWVDGARESERFVFYEAGTREAPSVAVRRSPSWAPGARRYELHNSGRHSAHDVFLVHREGGRTYVSFVPSIPAGGSARVTLEDDIVPRRRLRQRTRGRLRSALVDSATPRPPRFRMSMDDCVMQRDPAVPVERSSGHRLYAQEVDVLLDTWARHLFDAPGTTLLYREADEYVDEEMPLSLYTDMFHFIELRRLSLAVVRDIAL